MLRIFKTRHFARWQRRTDLADSALRQAVDEMIDGLVDADLGGGVLKKRVALPGRGKRGGARTLVATKRGAQLEALQGLAMELLALSSQQLNIAVEDGGLLEISRDP